MTLGFQQFTINYRLIPGMGALIISPSVALHNPFMRWQQYPLLSPRATGL